MSSLELGGRSISACFSIETVLNHVFKPLLPGHVRSSGSSYRGQWRNKCLAPSRCHRRWGLTRRPDEQLVPSASDLALSAPENLGFGLTFGGPHLATSPHLGRGERIPTRAIRCRAFGLDDAGR